MTAVTATGETIDTINGASFAVAGSSNAIAIGTGTSISINGSSNTLALNGTDTVSLSSGAADSIYSDVSGDLVNLHTGTSATITGSGGYIGIVGTGVGVTANSETIDTAASASYTISGASNTMSLAPGSSIAIYGSSNQLGLSTSDMVSLESGANETIYSDDATDAVNLYSGTSATITGSKGYFGICGTGITVDASHESSDTVAKASFTLDGSDDRVHENTSVTSAAYGSSNTIDGNTGDDITFVGSKDDAHITNGTVVLGNNTSASVFGDGDKIDGTSSSHATVDGYDDPFSGNSTDSVNYVGGDYMGDTVAGGSSYDDGGAYGGGYGVYGSYALAGSKVQLKKALGRNIGDVAAFDAAQGDTSAMLAAQAGLDQARSMAMQAPSARAVLIGSSWDRRLVTWSLAGPSSDPGAGFTGAMNGTEQRFAAAACGQWAALSGLRFQEVPDGDRSDIRIGFRSFNTSNSSVVGYTSFRSAQGQIQAGATIRLEDPSQDATIAGQNGQLTYAGNGAQFEQVMLHEIGHALGLADDSDPHSIMYYAMTAQNRTLDSTDRAGIEQLYGTPSQQPPEHGGPLNQLIQAMSTFDVQGAHVSRRSADEVLLHKPIMGPPTLSEGTVSPDRLQLV